MPGKIAHDAETRKIDASKAVSARKFNDSQTEWKELLVRPVERGGPTQNKGDWPLFEDDEDNCGRDSAGDPKARERRCRAKCLEGVDIRIVCRVDILAGLQREVEEFDGDDRGESDSSPPRRNARRGTNAFYHAGAIAGTARMQGQDLRPQHGRPYAVPVAVNL